MSTVGQAIVTVAATAVGFVLGGPTGAAYGFTIGMGLGGALFPPEGEVPDPANGVDLQTSQYGIPIRYCRGRVKVAGNLLWYGNFRRKKVKSGGKGGGGGSTSYTYSVSLAFGLCVVPPGTPVTLLRAWKGTEELDVDGINVGSWKYGLTQNSYFYDGSQTEPNPHLAQFVPRAPVWKNLCYVVLPNHDLGGGTYVKNLTFEIQVGNDADCTPALYSTEILTDPLFGLGMDPGLLDLNAAAETDAYCNANDLKMALVFDRQLSVLDCLRHIISHHDGYVTYSDGVIGHRQRMPLPAELPNISADNMVRDGDGFPSAVSYQGGRDYINKVTIEYTKRAADYVTGTAPIEDQVDIDRFGLRDQTIKLAGLTTYNRAAKLALLALRRNLSAPATLEFTVGPNLAGITSGEVFAVTIPDMELDNEPYRAMTISEDDNYRSVITAVREPDVFDLHVLGADSSQPPQPPSLAADPLAVVRPMCLEVPPLYSAGASLLAVGYSQSESLSWAGAILHRAYSSGGAYEDLSAGDTSGITGEVIAVGPGTIDVEADWDATLSSAISFDALVRNRLLNLAVFRAAGGDRFVKYQTVELIGDNQWRLSGLLFDIDGVPLPGDTGDIAVGDDVLFYESLPHVLTIPEADRNLTLYYKAASYNLDGQMQSLAEAEEIAVPLKNLLSKPLPPCNFAVNGIGLHDGTARVDTTSDTEFTWVSRNRAGIGATNYARTDTVVDDTDLVHFLVKVYSGQTLLQSNTTTSKSFTYSAADRTADGNPSPVTIQVSQVGTVETSDVAEFSVTYA